MSAGWPQKQELPPDTRPHALLLDGLARGALIVFLPVFIAGQAIAWLTYAVSHWYRPWSWFKIGLAEALASVRVTFTTTHVVRNVSIFGGIGAATEAVLQVAIGALTVAVVVLAFRAGREQGKGLERRPRPAALAGSAVGLGFAIPMVVAALPVTPHLPAVRGAIAPAGALAGVRVPAGRGRDRRRGRRAGGRRARPSRPRPGATGSCAPSAAGSWRSGSRWRSRSSASW